MQNTESLSAQKQSFRQALAHFIVDLDVSVEMFTASHLHSYSKNSYIRNWTRQAFDNYLKDSQDEITAGVEAIGGISIKAFQNGSLTNLLVMGIHGPVYGRPGFNQWYVGDSQLPQIFASASILEYLNDSPE